MGKTQRTKGHSWERAVAIMFQKIGFKDARRQLEYHGDDANGIDLQGTGDIKVQCKALKKTPNIPKVFGEFQGLTDDDIPMIAFKVDRKGSYACFKLEDAMWLIDMWENYQSGNNVEM